MDSISGKLLFISIFVVSSVKVDVVIDFSVSKNVVIILKIGIVVSILGQADLRRLRVDDA